MKGDDEEAEGANIATTVVNQHWSWTAEEGIEPKFIRMAYNSLLEEHGVVTLYEDSSAIYVMRRSIKTTKPMYVTLVDAAGFKIEKPGESNTVLDLWLDDESTELTTGSILASVGPNGGAIVIEFSVDNFNTLIEPTTTYTIREVAEEWTGEVIDGKLTGTGGKGFIVGKATQFKYPNDSDSSCSADVINTLYPEMFYEAAPDAATEGTYGFIHNIDPASESCLPYSTAGESITAEVWSDGAFGVLPIDVDM